MERFAPPKRSSGAGAALRRKYLAECSASLDPYEVRLDPADGVKVTAWVKHVHEELQAHRSPFIAAEILLKQIEEYSRSMNHPDTLYMATVVPVLDHCTKALTGGHQEVVSAAIHELLPAVLFTRSETLRQEPEVFTRYSYAECFMRIYSIFLKHRDEIEAHQQRTDMEDRVLNRVVYMLDSLWLRTCFLSWRTYCRRIRAKKQLFRRIIDRGTAGQIVPMFIRRWRQYAHGVLLNAKVARRSALQKELDALIPIEQEAITQHEMVSAEIKDKLHQLEEWAARVEQTKEHYKTIANLHHETLVSLFDHWNAWKVCALKLFNDAFPVKSLDDNTEDSAFFENITDSSETYLRRARSRVSKSAVKQLQTFLRQQGALVTSKAADKDQRKTPKVYVEMPAPPPSYPLTISTVTGASYPIPSPLKLMDMLHHDSAKLNVVRAYLTFLYCGGHCSLYSPCLTDAQRAIVEVPSQLIDVAASGTSLKALPGSVEAIAEQDRKLMHELERLPSDLGQSMLEEALRGAAHLEGAVAANENYLLSVRRSMMSTEIDLMHDFIGRCFSQLSRLGLPLVREKIECVIESMISDVDFPVLQALYPPAGILSFMEFANYLTVVAEYSSLPVLTLAERLDSEYAFDARDDYSYAFTSDEVVQFFKANADHLGRLTEYLLVKEGGPVLLSKSKAIQLLTERLYCGEEEAERVWREAGSDPDKVRKDELDAFLFLAAQVTDPSPFTSNAEKLGQVLNTFVPFLLDLR